jgi:membrane protease YdiL (CAAX protease family)
MTKTVVAKQKIEDDSEFHSPRAHIPILALAGLFLLIGVVWRNVDVFILDLGNSSMNILPCKLFPLLLIVGFFWYYGQEEISTILGLNIQNTRTHAIIGITTGISLYLLGNVLATIIYATFFDPSLGLELVIIEVNLLWYSAIFFLINAIYEETLFRGLLQNGLRDYVSPNRAILFSAMIFGIYHIIWPIFHAETNVARIMVTIVFSGLLGGVFGVYYEKFSNRSTLLGPIFAHWVLNFLNENFKVSTDEIVSGPDVLLVNPVQMGIALLLVTICFSLMFYFFWKYRVEKVHEWTSRISSALLKERKDDL